MESEIAIDLASTTSCKITDIRMFPGNPSMGPRALISSFSRPPSSIKKKNHYQIPSHNVRGAAQGLITRSAFHQGGAESRLEDNVIDKICLKTSLGI